MSAAVDPGVQGPGQPEPRQAPRPAALCHALLDALDATEGRRRRRKRDTRPDAIGIGIKRTLLEGAVQDDPDPDAFEGWLLERCFEQGAGEGSWRAMALEIFDEWRMAATAPSFRTWLESGAPSDDKPESGPVPGRAGLPILVLLPLLILAGCGGEGEDVPTMEVEELSLEDRQTAGLTTPVLEPLLAGPGPDSTIYEPPVRLDRPEGVTRWPPATGTEGDEAVGAAPDTATSAPGDTAGAAADTATAPGDTASTGGAGTP